MRCAAVLLVAACASCHARPAAAEGGAARPADQPGGGGARAVSPWVDVSLGPPIGGFTTPVFLTNAGDGTGRMFVVQQDGVVKVVDKDGRVEAAPFLDVRSLLGRVGGEQGLLGLAFHPRFKQNGRLFIAYTDARQNDAVAEVHASAAKADAGTVRVLFAIPDFASNHNGGMLAFAPDGKLVIGAGDGGGAGDPHRSAQDDHNLLGKILRLDVDNLPGNARARPEVLLKGMRNPWRFSFDGETGELWIGDVGQDKWEEIDVVTPTPGLNLGWSCFEGTHRYDKDEQCGRVVMPVFEYSHKDGCSVTGGAVYRGKAQPALAGTYVFADFCSGRLWEMKKDAAGFVVAPAFESHIAVSSFGQDEAGEVWLVDYGNGAVRKVLGVKPRAAPR